MVIPYPNHRREKNFVQRCSRRSIHVFLYASIYNVASIADLPNYFCEHRNIFLMYRFFENSMFLDSSNDAASFFVLEESFSLSARVWSFCPSFL